jgi:hypothetical protein
MIISLEISPVRGESPKHENDLGKVPAVRLPVTLSETKGLFLNQAKDLAQDKVHEESRLSDKACPGDSSVASLLQNDKNG